MVAPRRRPAALAFAALATLVTSLSAQVAKNGTSDLGRLTPVLPASYAAPASLFSPMGSALPTSFAKATLAPPIAPGDAAADGARARKVGDASGGKSPGSLRIRSYAYEGQQIELTEVPGVFSVGHAPEIDAQPPVTVQFAATHRATIFFSEAVPEVWKAELQIEELDSGGAVSNYRPATEAESDQLVSTIHVVSGVDWVYPALKNPATDTLLLPTPQLILKLAAGAGEEAVAALPGIRPVRKLRLTQDQYLVEVADISEHPCDAAERLQGLGEVEWIEPDFVQFLRTDYHPNDPQFNNQWHLRNTGQGGGISGADARLPRAWNSELGNGNAVIAVIDDGVQLAHPDFAGRIFANLADPINGVDNDGNGYIDDVNGWDFFSNDRDPNPVLTGPGSHGTSVAGVAAAAGNNALGVTGACMNCRILPVRISSTSGFATNARIAEAILYAGEFAWVLNNSWGGGSPAAAITNAVNAVATTGAGGLGTPVVFSAGNYGSAYVTLPGPSLPAGTYTFQWVFLKDNTVSAGFDRAWLDSVTFPGGSSELFEGCSGLPAGWATNGAAPWGAVVDETRSSSDRGGRCAIRSGTISHGQFSGVQVLKNLAVGGAVSYRLWVSAERNTVDGTGPLVLDNGTGTPECYDGVQLWIYDAALNPIWAGNFLCGTYSNQGPPLMDGSVIYPASLSNAIAIGAATNSDRRSDYSQWGAELDFVAHSAGGSLGVTTTDIVGANGYSSNDYYSSFGGTSSAAPLASGILGLLLSERPDLTLAQIRQRMQVATRKIGSVVYSGGRNNQYGYGALSAEMLLGIEAPSTCVPSSTTLCLNQGRFRATVSWRTPQGTTGSGRAIPYTTDSGFFWFFQASNLEMMIKVLNACVAPYNRFWVFHAATTNVEYTLTVTDTVTGTIKTYFNPLNRPAETILDTAAFATCGGMLPLTGEDEGPNEDASGSELFDLSQTVESASEDESNLRQELQELAELIAAREQAETGGALEVSAPLPSSAPGAVPVVPLGDSPLVCSNTSTALCLNNLRFRATVNWRTAQGTTGSGQAIPYTTDSGFFWFFQASNLEMMIKVLNACVAPYNRYWVFHAATTNVEYTLTVTDTQTGQVRTYYNPLNHPATTILDTNAFATCP